MTLQIQLKDFRGAPLAASIAEEDIALDHKHIFGEFRAHGTCLVAANFVLYFC